MMNMNFNTNYHQALEHWLDVLADQGVFTTDPNLKIISWNHWLEIHSGLSASETIGRNLFEVYPTLAKKESSAFIVRHSMAKWSCFLSGYIVICCPCPLLRCNTNYLICSRVLASAR
jgi:transcriptional regulator with PAS, ATPase and Fis domain